MESSVTRDKGRKMYFEIVNISNKKPIANETINEKKKPKKRMNPRVSSALALLIP